MTVRIGSTLHCKLPPFPRTVNTLKVVPNFHPNTQEPRRIDGNDTRGTIFSSQFQISFENTMKLVLAVTILASVQAEALSSGGVPKGLAKGSESGGLSAGSAQGSKVCCQGARSSLHLTVSLLNFCLCFCY
jgi:hypothetical protein